MEHHFDGSGHGEEPELHAKFIENRDLMQLSTISVVAVKEGSRVGHSLAYLSAKRSPHT